MKNIALLPFMLTASLSAHAAAPTPLKFHSISMPGKSVGMSAINASGNMVGDFWAGVLETHTRVNCFLYSSATGKATIFTNPAAHGATECWGLDDQGDIGGDYITSHGIRAGFLFSGGAFMTVNYPGAVETVVRSVTVGPQAAGYYIDTAGVRHGFVFFNGYTTQDIPGDTQTGLFGISDSGVYAAQSLSATGKHVSNAICCSISPVDFPGSVANFAYQVSDSALIATTWVDPKSVVHGGIFNFADSVYLTVDVPGAAITEARGVNNSSQVVGRFQATNTSRSIGFYTTGTP